MHNAVSKLSVCFCTFSVFLYAILVYAYVDPVGYTLSSINKDTMSGISLNWFAPSSSWITDLATVINGTGTYGFRFDGSLPPANGQYSYCNMEHVRPQDYQVPDKSKYELTYVEVVSTNLLKL